MEMSRSVINRNKNELGVVDVDWLETWIRPQHLTDESLARYGAEYESAPIPCIQLRNFLQPSVAENLSGFLAEDAEYEDVYCLRVPDKRVSRSVWLAAKDSNRLSKYSRVTGTRSGSGGINSLVYIKFSNAVADRRFIAFFERIAKTPLGPLQAVGGKAFGAADFLRPHNDQGFDRRLAFIIYLNPRWRPTYGGRLCLRGGNGERMTIEAEYNSLVVFDVNGHKAHHITTVEEVAENERRVTVGGWIKNP